MGERQGTIEENRNMIAAQLRRMADAVAGGRLVVVGVTALGNCEDKGCARLHAHQFVWVDQEKDYFAEMDLQIAAVGITKLLHDASLQLYADSHMSVPQEGGPKG